MKTWKVAKRDGVEGIILREIDRELKELPDSAFGTTTQHDEDGRVLSVDVPEERFLPFAKPGARVGAKQIYTVTAEKPDGTVIQIPLEDQINNNVASPENAIGLQLYIRKGFNVWFDMETGEQAHCPTWDCWAKYNKKFDGYCSEAHREISKGETDEVAGKGFSKGVTTTRGWS